MVSKDMESASPTVEKETGRTLPPIATVIRVPLATSRNTSRVKYQRLALGP